MSPPGFPPPDLEGSGLPWTNPAILYAERDHKSATCRRYSVEIPPRIQQKTLQQGSRSGKYHFNSARAEPAELFLQTWAPNKGKSFICRISGGGRVCSAADRREQKQNFCSMLLCKAGLGPPQRREQVGRSSPGDHGDRETDGLRDSPRYSWLWRVARTHCPLAAPAPWCGMSLPDM